MRTSTTALLGLGGLLLCSACGGETGGSSEAIVPLKEAKLNIEHNATDLDTGFQGAIDSEGWERLGVLAPDGSVILDLEAQGKWASLGLTELFFETVEPENATVPIEEMLARAPAGEYTIEGPGMEIGAPTGHTLGKALLTHDIPEGPVLMHPPEDAVVPTHGLVMRWSAVSRTITGEPVDIISYQLIVEKDEEPHPHMIGKRGSLSMYLPPTVTSLSVPDEFLEPGTAYDWEVLAIEESGNQTLSSGSFETE